MEENKKRERIMVKAESPSCACGYIGHMTVSELKERALGEEFDARCPVCRQIHLTREEIEELESQKITRSEKFCHIKEEAEARGNMS
ncbi:hypothetical protein DBT_1330 [Dissulfuribacter thermophilus]|uniref:Uncharacterized protein n=1 Tax=Dissulfuribacter thermophilus TaxID=1156395 RepID=A0A1B9F5I8_9BACT|nr:hypothetical protein [Dissulfuribacter thermophilus]OCC15207.1 hypothetical protein DBT_1330 [Dissulfuribacter thermophilus]